MKLEFIDNYFSFSLLEKKDRLNELEFYFPYSLIENSSYNTGYFTGFVDLVFRYNGLYYIVDWKTNYLKNYSENYILESMNESAYHNQYMIYCVAFRKWCGQFNLDFEKCFGGVYYFYLRGIDIADSSKGVFFKKPENSEIDDFILKMKKIIW
jgi:exodeoxyribonuclease V beta subunit